MPQRRKATKFYPRIASKKNSAIRVIHGKKTKTSSLWVLAAKTKTFASLSLGGKNKIH